MKAKCSYCGFRGEPVDGKCVICDASMEVHSPSTRHPKQQLKEAPEKENRFIKKVFSLFNKKADDKKIENVEKIEKKERKIVDSMEKTTTKGPKVGTARKAVRMEGETKKCPHCGSDLSSGKNVRSRKNNDRVYAEEEDDSDSEIRYQPSRLMMGNFFFPDTLILSDDGISFQEGSLFGSKPRHFNYREVAFVRVNRGILFSDIRIEFVRKPPISLDGLLYDEAKEIKNTIRSFRGKRDFDDDDEP